MFDQFAVNALSEENVQIDFDSGFLNVMSSKFLGATLIRHPIHVVSRLIQ